MTSFDSFVVVDWSAGNDTGPRPRKDAIWAATVKEHKCEDPVYLRNRTVAFDWLVDLIEGELSAGRRLLLGFDFPFGYPGGFAEALTGQRDALNVWEFFADQLQDAPSSNNRFALAAEINRKFPGTGPFWFNGMRTDIPDLPRLKSERDDAHGLPERRQCEEKTKGTFTCWQMGGAGAVGGQVMTGMATLARLRKEFHSEIAVWPMQSTDAPVVFVEVWPSLLADAVRRANDPIKDRAQVMLLARALATLSASELAQMMTVYAPEEGWILGVGHEDKLRAALCPA